MSKIKVSNKTRKKKRITTKDSKSFMRELKERRTEMTQILCPRACYAKKYGMFSINWGNKKIASTIEVNLLGAGDLRFDVTKDGTIVGIEIEDLTKVLEKFNCDKNEK